jgi:hypothetical protein
MTATNTTSLLLPLCQDNSAITMATHTYLLLFSIQDDSAIMMATHTSYSLQLIVTFVKPNANIPLSDLERAQHAQINLRTFQLIVNLSLIPNREGARAVPITHYSASEGD